MNCFCRSLRWMIFIFLIGFKLQVFAQEKSAENESPHSHIDPELSMLPIYEHRPMYGLVGRHDAKIQMSFKGKLIRNTELYVGYTQLFLWDVYKHSIPIRDINYNPELFYRYAFGENSSQWIDFGIYEHESNGLDVPVSRAWDRSYLRYHGRFTLRDDLHFFWNIKAWWPWRIDSTNKDIRRYRGLWEFDITLKNIASWIFEVDELNFRSFPGGRYYTNPAKGGQELSLRGKIKAKNFLPFIVIQAFHGYGENLLDYKRSRFEIRGGLGY